MQRRLPCGDAGYPLLAMCYGCKRRRGLVALLRELAKQQWLALTSRRGDFRGLPFPDIVAVRRSFSADTQAGRGVALRAVLAGSGVPQAVAWR